MRRSLAASAAVAASAAAAVAAAVAVAVVAAVVAAVSAVAVAAVGGGGGGGGQFSVPDDDDSDEVHQSLDDKCDQGRSQFATPKRTLLPRANQRKALPRLPSTLRKSQTTSGTPTSAASRPTRPPCAKPCGN